MTVREIRSKAKALNRELSDGEISFSKLSTIVEARGYTVICFSNVDYDRDIADLLSALNIADYAKNSKGFTYIDGNYRLVFVNDALSPDEKCIVLAHECGHIVCCHMGKNAVLGQDVQEEYEANEFAHFLLNRSLGIRAFSFCRKNKKKLAVATIALFVLFGIIFACCSVATKNSYYGEYYVTATGVKYHEKECICVKNKTNVHRLTQQEFEENQYSPCEICLP